MNTSPLVSVIVPCYNQAIYLPETLQSVLEQSYSNWECIIVNDGSPDNTEEVALQWCKKDQRFKYLSKINGGLADARNFGIKHSQGKYILPLDSDDKISKMYMSEAVSILEKDENVKLVYSKAMQFGAKNKKWKLAEYHYEDFLVKNMIFCSCFYRRKDYDQTSGYSADMKWGWEDWEFLIRLLKKEDKVIRINKYHFFYRRKQGSMHNSITLEKKDEMFLQLFRMHEELYLQYLNPIKNYRKTKFHKERRKRKIKKMLHQFLSVFKINNSKR